MAMKKLGGLLGLMTGAAALLPDEAEAARPKYMEDLVEKLKTGDFTPMDFGRISGRQLRKLQDVDPAFTEGPLRLSGKNIEKFSKKRINNDGLSPEEFVDGRNSVFHGTRSRAFPNKEAGNSMLLRPVGEYAWKGVIAPHDGFSGLVTGYGYPVEDRKKELSLPSEGRPLPSYPHIPEEIASREGTLPGRFTTVEDKEKLFNASNIPGMDALRKGIRSLREEGPPRLPDEARAAVSAEQYRFPADEPGHVNREPGLGTPLVDVADFLTAPSARRRRWAKWRPWRRNPSSPAAWTGPGTGSATERAGCPTVS